MELGIEKRGWGCRYQGKQTWKEIIGLKLGVASGPYPTRLAVLCRAYARPGTGLGMARPARPAEHVSCSCLTVSARIFFKFIIFVSKLVKIVKREDRTMVVIFNLF